MARKPRVEYAGAVYHLMSRGDRQNLIFRDNRDKEVFMDTLSEACIRQGWRIHAFVLLSNHYHLLLETPEPNLVSGMKWLQGTYTQRFNSRHKEWGHLFQGRYKALVIQTDNGGYFSTVAAYIHLNPVRAGLMNFTKSPLADFAWSSYPLYLHPSRRPEWLCVERVLGNYQWQDDRSGREAYRRVMQKRILEITSSDNPAEFDERWAAIRRGWCLGDSGFHKEMERRINQRISGYDRRSYLGEEARKHDEAEALRLLDRGLSYLNLKKEDLPNLKKGDTRKKIIAWLLRQHTGVRNDWICDQLAMGKASNLARHVAAVKNSEVPEIIAFRKMMKKAF
jgi:REP element-mobilizing transposase RayT